MSTNTKKVAIMQPYVFPYLGYFQLIHSTDIFVFYDDVNFIKKGWINRNQLLLNGEAYKFTIPLIGASQNKLIHEIDVFWESKFSDKLFQQISQAYKSAPHVEAVLELVKSIFEQQPSSISELAILSVKKVCDFVGLKRDFYRSSELAIAKDAGRAERLIEITKHFESSEYVNAVNGQELYTKDFFKKSAVNLHFLSPILSAYPQGASQNFIPFLSIIDVLMWNKKEDVLSLISQYEII